MSFEYNSNGGSFRAVDTFIGGTVTTIATDSLGMNRVLSAIAGGSSMWIPGGFTTGLGTAVRYGLGGGMDTYTFKDGSKVYQFSDGDEVIMDKNGKYVGSTHSSSGY